MNRCWHTKRMVALLSFIMTLVILFSGCAEQKIQPAGSSTNARFTASSDSPGYYSAKIINVSVKDKAGTPCIRAITGQNNQLIAFVSIVDPITFTPSYFLESYNTDGKKIDETDITSDFTQGIGSLDFCTDGAIPFLLDCQSDRITIFNVDTSNLALRKSGEIMNMRVSELVAIPQISPAQTLFCSRMTSSGITIEEYSLSGQLLRTFESDSFRGGVYFLNGDTYALGTKGEADESELFLLGDSDTDILPTSQVSPVRNMDQIIIAGTNFYAVTSEGISLFDTENRTCSRVIDWQKSGLDAVLFSYTGVSVKISDSLIRYDQRQRSLSKCRQIAENMMTNSRKELFV